ncbi:hypothetical protein AB4Z22_33290 [Paenibacillus sp. TAF58]
MGDNHARYADYFATAHDFLHVLVWVLYAEGCLQSFSIRFGQIVRELSSPSQSALHPLGHFVGNAAGWLSRAVRPIINVNLWITDPFCIHDRDLLG